jgi:hypothetical protein
MVHKTRAPLHPEPLSHSHAAFSIAFPITAVQKQENHGQVSALSTPLSYFCYFHVSVFRKMDTLPSPLPMRFCLTFPLFLAKLLLRLGNIYIFKTRSIRTLRIPAAPLAKPISGTARPRLPQVTACSRSSHNRRDFHHSILPTMKPHHRNRSILPDSLLTSRKVV